MSNTEMLSIKQAAVALGFSPSTFYIAYVNPGIVKETGWFGKARYWDAAGIVQAAVAINEHNKIKEERREARRQERLHQATQLAEKYKTGMTLEEIGAQEGVTRERVRQRLSLVGVTGSDGGKRVSSISNSARREREKVERRDAHCRESYGCSFSEFCEITGTRKLSRHKSSRLLNLWWGNKGNASCFNIPWLFTLPQYVALLKGKENFFKRERDGLVLARKDKTGPFSPENCSIVTLSTNSAWTGGFKIAHAKREELARKVKTLSDSGIAIPVLAKQFKCSRARICNLLATAKRLEAAV